MQVGDRVLRRRGTTPKDMPGTVRVVHEQSTEVEVDWPGSGMTTRVDERHLRIVEMLDRCPICREIEDGCFLYTDSTDGQPQVHCQTAGDLP